MKRGIVWTIGFMTFIQLSIGFSNELRFRQEIFKRAFFLLSQKLVKAPDAFGEWSDETSHAIRGAIARIKGANLDDIAVVRSWLITPGHASDYASQLKYLDIQRSVIAPVAEYAICVDVIRGVVKSGLKRSLKVRIAPPDLSTPASAVHLGIYLRHHIYDILRVFDEALDDQRNIELSRCLDQIKRYFLKYGSLSEKPLAVLQEHSDALERWASQLDEQVEGIVVRLRMMHSSSSSLYIDPKLKKQVDQFLALSRYLKLYSISLVSRGVQYLEFYLAKIRYASLEIQLQALEGLYFYVGKTRETLTRGQLREILLHSSHAFRRSAVKIIIGQEKISERVSRIIQAELEKTVRFHPGDIEFDAAIESIIFLMRCPSHLEDLASNALLTAETVVEKIGIIRGLGQLETESAMRVLDDVYFLAADHPEVRKAYVYEVVHNMRVSSDFFSKGRQILERMYSAPDVAVRRDSIRGLWLAVGDLDKELFPRLLMVEKDPTVVAEIFRVLSIHCLDNRVLTAIKGRFTACLGHSNAEVRLGAALFFVTHGDVRLRMDGLATIFAEMAQGVKPTVEMGEAVLGILRQNLDDNRLDSQQLLQWLSFVPREHPLYIEGILMLTERPEPIAVELLFELIPRLAPFQKERILTQLVTHYQDKESLRKILQEVIKYCDAHIERVQIGATAQMRFLLPSQYSLLKGDREMEDFLITELQNPSHFIQTKEFLRAIAAYIMG